MRPPFFVKVSGPFNRRFGPKGDRLCQDMFMKNNNSPFAGRKGVQHAPHVGDATYGPAGMASDGTC